jgi:four helix bundle protein
MHYQNDLRDRTKKFALLRIIRLSSSLKGSREADVIGKQILRSGTSVGAQFRESFRSKSNADYISKIEGAIGELDETQYWLELIVEASLKPKSVIQDLMQEADELMAILTTIIRKVKAKK